MTDETHAVLAALAAAEARLARALGALADRVDALQVDSRAASATLALAIEHWRELGPRLERIDQRCGRVEREHVARTNNGGGCGP